MAAPADQLRTNFPVAGETNDGWSSETEATATCYCGAVQLVFVRIFYGRSPAHYLFG